MVDWTNQRTRADRRGQPRGGRRPSDVDGFAPRVMVVGDYAAVGDAVGAVLAQLKFAVTPSPDADEALRVLSTMQPDIIVANAADAGRIRRECPELNAIVVVTAAMRDDPQLLVEAIRRTIRSIAGEPSA